MNYLKQLQAKPYEEKIQILKIASVITALLIVGVWGLTLKFRSTEQGDVSKFNQIWLNIKELGSKFRN